VIGRLHVQLPRVHDLDDRTAVGGEVDLRRLLLLDALGS